MKMAVKLKSVQRLVSVIIGHPMSVYHFDNRSVLVEMSKCPRLTLHSCAFLKCNVIKLDYTFVIKIDVCSVLAESCCASIMVSRIKHT